MWRDIELPHDGQIVSAGEQLVEIDFGSVSPDRMVAELLLLSERLIEGLTIRREGSKHRVRIRRSDTKGCAVASWREDSLEIGLSDREIGSWLSFFLKYYRDGMAEVDHIDIEASSAREGIPPIDIVLKVAHAQPPLSAEEARRRLGL